MLPVVTALVTRRQRLAPVREHSSAARARTLPRPDAVPARQRLRRGVPLAVEEVSLILAGCGIVADDLEPSHLDRPDAAVCGVHDEVATRRPVVHVAGEDSRGGSLCTPCRLALGDPTADEHIGQSRSGERCAAPVTRAVATPVGRSESCSDLRTGVVFLVIAIALQLMRCVVSCSAA